MASEIFKTVIKGYQKEEVIAYIEKLNRNAEELQKELEETRAKLLRLEEERGDEIALQKQTEEDQAALRESVAAEITPELRAQIEEQLRNEMQSGGAQAELDDVRRRAQLYDDNREILAELMIQAKNDAAQTIREAEVEAQKMREEADQRFRLLTSDYDLLKKNLMASKEEVASRLYGIIRQLDEFEQKFSCAEQDIYRTADHLQE